MWIVIAGSGPIGGFSFYGPFKTDEKAGAAGKMIGIMHGGDGSPNGGEEGDPWWTIPLDKVEPEDLLKGDASPDDDEETPGSFYNGAIVFDGNIAESEWVFSGPFDDIAAARKFARWKKLGRGCAIRLLRPFEPLTEEQERAWQAEEKYGKPA